MAKFIALAVIAAGVAGTAEIAAGATFEASDEVGAKLVADGAAKVADVDPAPSTKPAAKAGGVKARVLVDCVYGKVDEVVSLSADDAKAGEKSGVLDAHKSAVAYAESLAANRPKN
jgi:hypothetical protein